MISCLSLDLSILTFCILAIVATLYIFKNSFKGKWIKPPGKSILITGCDSGLGLEAAKKFSKQGFMVFAGCLFPEAEGAKELKTTNADNIILLDLDVTSNESMQNAFSFVSEELQKRNMELWAVVNNAGVCALGFFDWLTWPQIEKLVDVNFMGQIRVLKYFLPLVMQSQGRIISVSSIARLLPFPGTSVYTATKFGVEGLIEALRTELSSTSVQLIIIRPGNHSKVTNINKMQSIHAEQQWNAMNPEKRNEIQPLFEAYHKSVMHSKSKMKMTPEEMFRQFLFDLDCAIRSPSPAMNYISGLPSERIFAKIMAFLPPSWSSALISKAAAKLWKIKW